MILLVIKDSLADCTLSEIDALYQGISSIMKQRVKHSVFNIMIPESCLALDLFDSIPKSA